MATVPAQVRHLIDRAVRIARASAPVTCVIVPNDLQEEAFEEPPREHGTDLTRASAMPRRGWSRSRPTCERAAEVLNAGERSPSWSARAPRAAATR